MPHEQAEDSQHPSPAEGETLEERVTATAGPNAENPENVGEQDRLTVEADTVVPPAALRK